MQDLRFALRQLLKNPGFTTVAVLTLALCIGANLAIFAVVDAILIRPLPFPESERLVTMFNTYPKAGVLRDGSSLANYYERRGTLPAFSHLSLFRRGSAIVGEAGSTEREEIVRVSPEFFTTLGLSPKLGRAFAEEETTYQTDSVTVLTDEYWRQHFKADPGVIGRTLRVDGLSRTIVGVLPPGFRFLSSQAQLFFPLASNLEDRGSERRHWGSGSDIIARLKPGVSLAEAQAQIDAQNAASEKSNPEATMMADAGFRSPVVSLHADHVQSVHSTLWLLQGGVLILLLIGGVNLVNLLLIRASSQAKEVSVRQSLGASRCHVVRQVMTETVLVALIGGTFGLGLGAAGIRLLRMLGVDLLPLGAGVVLGPSLALLALGGAVVMGIVVALPVVWFHLRGHLAQAMGSVSRGSTAQQAAQRLRHGFIVAQIALAFVLLSGAGLLGLSLRQVLAVSPGFRSDHLLTGRITLPWKNYPDEKARVGFTERLLEEVRRLPGVRSAGVINTIPFSGNRQLSGINVKGHVLQPGETRRGHYGFGVTGDYFAAAGIPLREGRFIEAADSRRAERVCAVDEDFARRYWPQGNALGQRLFQSGEQDEAKSFTVVGVVGTVKQAELTEDQAQGAVYFPYQYRTDDSFFTVTRTSQPPETLGLALQRIVRGLDPELPVHDLRSMEVRIADSLLARRSPALLAGIFAGVALLLAAIGTFGVLAFAVTQRRREIGVRMALGALPRQIGRQFLGLGLRLLLAGIAFGVLGAWLAGRALHSVLFNVPSLHGATLAGTAAVLTLVSLTACLVPSLRASRVDPMEALRSE